MRLPEFWLFDGEGFIDEDASFFQGLLHRWYERPMEITKNEDSSVELSRQWIDPLPFKINLPELHAHTVFSRKPPGPGKGFSGFIAANHRQVVLGQKDSIGAIPTGQIQNGAGQGSIGKQA